MTSFFERPGKTLIAVLIFYTLFLLVESGSWGVIETSEARYAEISRAMYSSGDWIHPRLMGIQHFHKPPVTYWITAIGYSIFGTNAFGARFFLCVSFLIQLILVYKISGHLFEDLKVGLLSAIVYSSLPIVLTSVRGLTTDSFLNSFILGSIASWLYWRVKGKPFWLYLVALCLGLAFLTKGPVALLIPVLFFIGFNRLFYPEKSGVYHHYILASISFVVVALGWFIFLVAEDRSFLNYFFFRHTVERLTEAKVFVRTQPFWYYFAFAPLLAIPWIVPLVKTLFIQTASRKSVTAKRIVIVWIVLPFIFFSLSSSKLVLYILPLYSGLALLIGYWIRQWPEKLASLSVMSIQVFMVILSIAFFLLPIFYPVVSISLVGRILVIGGVMAFILFSRKSAGDAIGKLLLSSIMLNAILIIISVMVFTGNELMVNSTRPLTMWMQENSLADRQIIVYNRLVPSLAFNLQKDIISVHDGNRNLDREVQFEKNEQWRKTLFLLDKVEDRQRLEAVLEKPSVLVYKGTIKPTSIWLTRNFSHQKRFDEWVILY
ncbi:MAG: glycosyltransferase family 39 protein [Cyclobacteriaceae bacterium]|nr:glycosyltransferase family 39 protein [Cyclobacteriaceae bacterium]